MTLTRLLTATAALALCSLGNLASAGEYSWSRCSDHSYSPGTSVNGCGSLASGCGGTCGFTNPGQTYYYHTCDSAVFSSCTADPPLVVRISMTDGTCSGGIGGATGCQCAIGSTPTTGYISLPQCH